MNNGSVLWSLDQVTLTGDRQPRLADLSLSIPPGVTAVVGYSGAGKTSLLNVLVGFEQPDSGTVVSALPQSHNNRLPLFWVPQNDGLWPHLTVDQHLQTVVPPEDNSADQIKRLLDDFDLSPVADVLPDRLSQGERSRLSTARALASDAAILILDEPLVHVDPARLSNYWKVIRAHCRHRESSLVIATHAPEIVLREASQAICLNEGRVEFCGEVDELYYRPQSPELAWFLGPANWFSDEETANWFDKPETDFRCLRPEQLEITTRSGSPFVVESSRFAGSVAEIELRDERTDRKRRFYHRPAGDVFQAGERVLLKTCLLLLACWWLVGCRPADSASTLPVKNVNYWTMPPDGPRIPAPRGLTVGPDGSIYALDDAGRVLVFDESGELRRQWRMPEYDVGKPEGICVFQDGRLAVADTHYHRVVFFDADGQVIQLLGELGGEPGQFVYPVAITQDESEHFYVCEYDSQSTNDRVQKFTAEGEFVLQFGSQGTEPGEFQRPSGVVWHKGKVYVADAFNNRLQVFSDSGKFLGILGDSEPADGLHYPYDLTKTPAGELYVVEYGAGRVSKLNLDGKIVGRFGRTGSSESQFATPWGLATNGRDRVYVADTGNRRIVELEL